MTVLLRPFSFAYGAAAAVRRSMFEAGHFRRTRLPAPVISVGNLSVGGSGKTPVVAALAQMLVAAGHGVAILSRGYGGRFEGACLTVGDGRRVLATPAEVGDEPVMMARALPDVVVAVGPDRAVVGREVLKQGPHRVLLLDDGFQHLALERDLDILCVDDGTFEDHPLPEGRLREFPSAASRAHVIVDFGVGDRPAPSNATRVCARRQVLGFFDLGGGMKPTPERGYLVSALARPDRFDEDVAHTGVEIVGHDRHRDHHPFSREAIRVAAKRALAAGADAIVTTEKNAVWLDEPIDAPVPVCVMRIGVGFDPEAGLRDRLLAVAGPVRAS